MCFICMINGREQILLRIATALRLFMRKYFKEFGIQFESVFRTWLVSDTLQLCELWPGNKIPQKPFFDKWNVVQTRRQGSHRNGPGAWAPSRVPTKIYAFCSVYALCETKRQTVWVKKGTGCAQQETGGQWGGHGANMFCMLHTWVGGVWGVHESIVPLNRLNCSRIWQLANICAAY